MITTRAPDGANKLGWIYQHLEQQDSTIGLSKDLSKTFGTTTITTWSICQHFFGGDKTTVGVHRSKAAPIVQRPNKNAPNQVKNKEMVIG